MSFDLAPADAARLRRSAALRRVTEGRVETRVAAIGTGFRSRRMLRLDPATRIEMLLSLAAADPGASSALQGRLRLRLIEGDPNSLAECALRLTAGTPLRLASDSERDPGDDSGRDLAALDPEGTTDAALAAILRGCQTQLLSHQAGLALAIPEAVHQTRVGLRRLRAALGLFKPLASGGFATAIAEEARWLGGVLAPVRDLDVFLAESLAPFQARIADDPGFRELARQATVARAEAARGMAAAMAGSPRLLAFFLALEVAIQTRIWREPSKAVAVAAVFSPLRDVAPKLLDRRWRVVRRQAEALRFGDETVRHDLRKKIKKLRYSIEFIQCIGSRKDVRAYLAELSQMQQRLGVANDRAVAETLIAALTAGRPDPDLARAAGFILGWIAHAGATVPSDAAEGWERLRATPRFWR